ncbi:HDOD domain-containing protein [Thalassotalea ganghwensis]
MFKRVIESLFSDTLQTATSANYFYFEESRPQTESVDKKDDGRSVIGSSYPPVKPSKVIVQADIQADHLRSFYGFLFGEVIDNSLADPLTDQVYQAIENLFVEPSPLLEALPVLPYSVTTLMKELNNPDFNVDILIDIISHEPSMAADVIKLANSAGIHRGAKPVTDLKSAFMAMGSQGLMEGVVRSYLKNFVPSATIYYRRFGENIWQHCLTTAEYAKQLALINDPKQDANSAYFIGLICNLGEMIIFQILLDAFEYVGPEHNPNTLAFQQMLIKHAKKLSYDIATYWQFPETITRALSLQLTFARHSAKDYLSGSEISHKLPDNQLAFIVYQANLLAELTVLLSSGKLDTQGYQERLEMLNGSEKAQQFGLTLLSS